MAQNKRKAVPLNSSLTLINHKLNLQTLQINIRKCNLCKLSETRKNALPGEGPCPSRIMIIAQSPGKTEDLMNHMFVGPSGKIFDHLTKEAGLTRHDFYLTNLIKCLLPKSRRPSHDELEQCTPFISEEIKLVKPELVVPLGFHSTKYILRHFDLSIPPKKEFFQLFGKMIHLKSISILPLRHPTALLFNPEKEAIMTENYKKISALQNSSPRL